MSQPGAPYTFSTQSIGDALNFMEESGFCVIRGMLTPDWVDELKAAIGRVLDPDRLLQPGQNRFALTFAEHCPALWRLLEHQPFLEYMHQVHGTEALTLHRAAAILRAPGDPMGMWHTDHRGMVEKPKVANDIMNRYPMPSGNWFYLNGSDPDRSGIAVIEGSHVPGWEGPDGFELTRDGTSFNKIGGSREEGYCQMDVPGCVPVLAQPGDMICFAANCFHTNMATRERRYSCGFGLRPRSVKIDAPWPLPESAQKMRDQFPEHLRCYLDGYVSLDPGWRAKDSA